MVTEKEENQGVRRVALFGGSFNPPHVVHQMACLYTSEVGGVDEVWIMPCPDHPFGKVLAPFIHRVAMCSLAAQGLRGVSVSTVEDELDGPTRTLDTVRFLKNRHPDVQFVLVVGADILNETQKWYGWDELMTLVELFVLGRTGWGGGDTELDLPEVSSSLIRDRLRDGKPVDKLISKRVLNYIHENSLYVDDQE